mgnify:CR=1 FL=1
MADSTEQVTTTETPVTPTEPATEPSTLTAEAVSQMIAEAFQGFEQRQSEAKKLSEMTDQQRAETERDSYKQQLHALQKQVEAAQMQKTAREMLSEKGIHLPDSLVAAVVAEDAKTTKTQVEAFATLFTEAVENAVKERLKGEPPKTGTSGEQIFAILDEGKRLQAIRDNMNLFE